ncbi:MAG: rod shape-determining protein MreD [Verrucomicrobia bacterium]|nr:rod shape-determining protein MreD [Verrucomicrobiota bacterium]MCH8526716.1 rod shape-determining protein MreD [Kiritimatiellia bacterium]
MNRLLMIVGLCLCAIVQAILPPWLAMGQAKAPLLLAGVVYYALTRGTLQMAEAAMLGGLLQDSLGPIPLGFSVVAFAGVAILIHQFQDRIFADSFLTHVLTGFMAPVLVSIILYVLLVSGGYRAGVPFSFVMSKTLGMSLLGLVTFPLVFRFIRASEERLGIQSLRRANG